MNAVEAFQSAIGDAGLGVVDVVPDTQLHRFYVDSDRAGSKNGWYVFYPHGVASGAFGSWKTGTSFSWCSKNRNTMSPVEKAALSEMIRQAKRKRDAEQKRVNAEAADKCRELWAAASDRIDHPYIATKSIKPYGLRQLQDVLLVPLHLDGELVNIQFIGKDGRKRFKAGGRVQGSCCTIGEPGDTIYIVEGFATGASIFEAVGGLVIIAFNTGNLLSGCKSIRQKYPEAQILVCGDNDQWTDGNPGITKGKRGSKFNRCRIRFAEVYG